MLLALCSLLLCACGRESLDLAAPIHLVPDDSFWGGCFTQYDRDVRQAAVQAGWDEWFVALPPENRPRVVWGARGPSNNVRLVMRDFHGEAAGKFGWHDGDGVVTFAVGGISEMVASHEFGHALLNGDDSDHVACGANAQDVMADSLLCWGPVTPGALARVCAMHPDLDCSGIAD